MNREEYTARRNELYAQAEGMINAGDTEGAEGIMAEITALDARYEADCTARANLQAMSAAPAIGAGLEAGVISDAVTAAAKPVDKDAIYRTAFAKSLMGVDLTSDESTVLAEVNRPENAANTAKDNALLIPMQEERRIWTVAASQHAVYGDVQRTFVNADLKIIKENGNATDAEWLTEADSMSDGSVGFGSLTLTGCELAKCIPVSWSLKKMAIEDFMTYIGELIGRKIGAAMAKAEILGLGKPGVSDGWKPQPKGIVTALEAESGTPQVITYSKGGSMDYSDFTAAFAKIASGYSRIIYASSKTIWGNIANIKDANKRPMFITDPVGGGVGRIFGAIVKADDAVPDGAVLIGDVARGYKENVKENISIVTEDHVKTRTTDYAAYAIVDGDVIDTKAFAYIKEADA